MVAIDQLSPRYTFVEDTRHPQSCTILLKGQNEHTIAQLKDAVRDGLRAVKNVIDDKALVAGGAAFELALHRDLVEFNKTVSGKAKLGVQAFADALLIIPKCLAQNSGFDVSDTLIKVQEQAEKSEAAIGLDVTTGEGMIPSQQGVWDNYIVKRQFLQLATMLASQLLLVDEVMRAGRGARQ